MAETAEKADPKLWDKVKREVTNGDKGGETGQWSARKAQLATQEYKKRGGGYVGKKSADNSLAEWSREDWGTQSGEKSKDTGERYLPKAARAELSDAEYARTTAKKRRDKAAGKQFSRQPKDVADKTGKHRDGHGDPAAMTKAALMDEARTLQIAGRSKMDKAALAKAVAKARG